MARFEVAQTDKIHQKAGEQIVANIPDQVEHNIAQRRHERNPTGT